MAAPPSHRQDSTHVNPSCFVVMPGRPDLDVIYALIKQTASKFNLECKRADQDSRAGNIVSMILEDIERADIVISDLTGRNPNVFYETAIAHTRKGYSRVVLIAQSDDDVPFDLQALRYQRYDNNRTGRRILREQLRDSITQSLQASPGQTFETIEGMVDRTRRIVAECEAYLHSGSSRIESLILRTQAGLSCLAIDDRELESAPHSDLEYRKLLIAERNVTRELIHKGARFRAMLSPPGSRLVGIREAVRCLEYRFERLIRILEGKNLEPEDDCLLSDRCEIVLSPYRGNHYLFFGDRLLYEGLKGGLTGGFVVTTRVTNQDTVAAHIRAFDGMFDEAKKYTLEHHGTSTVDSSPKGVRQAVLAGLKDAHRRFLKEKKAIKNWS